MARLSRLVRPTTEPVTEEEICAFCRLVQNPDGSFDPADLAITRALGIAARETVETEAARTLSPTTWRLRLDGCPGTGGYFSRAARRSGYPLAFGLGTATVIRLPRPPLIEIVSVQYRDQGGNLVTLDPALYQAEGGTDGPATLAPLDDRAWPLTGGGTDALTIVYRAGYLDPADIPESARTAIKLLAKYWFDVEGEAGGVPDYVEALINNCDWGGGLG